MAFPCRVINIWHDSPFVLSNDNFVATDFTPVAYAGGAGRYTVMGYIGVLCDDYISVILSNSFNITEGNPPEDGVPVLCDAIKNAINKALADTISIVKMELKFANKPTDINVIVDNIDLPESLPKQLVEIHKWTLKKLITDYDATLSDDLFQPEYYFRDDANISAVTQFITKWDQFENLISMGIAAMVDEAQQLHPNADQRPYFKEIRADLRKLRDLINQLDSALIAHDDLRGEQETNLEHHEEENTDDSTS